MNSCWRVITGKPSDCSDHHVCWKLQVSLSLLHYEQKSVLHEWVKQPVRGTRHKGMRRACITAQTQAATVSLKEKESSQGLEAQLSLWHKLVMQKSTRVCFQLLILLALRSFFLFLSARLLKLLSHLIPQTQQHTGWGSDFPCTQSHMTLSHLESLGKSCGNIIVRVRIVQSLFPMTLVSKRTQKQWKPLSARGLQLVNWTARRHSNECRLW